MKILGHGIDVVSVPRIAEMLARHADRFIERCFTPEEARYCAGRKAAAEHFAARFAAKEAFLKAVGTGLTTGISWTEIEVARAPTGRPSLALTGSAQARFDALGATGVLLSLSHTHELAAASVIITGL